VIPFVLSVAGGEVTINGEKIRVENHAMATKISNDKEYLLFLTRFGTEGLTYALNNGGIFEIENGHARALAMNANTVFKGSGQAPVDELIQRVRGLDKKRSE
jgi:hypothetical protein